MKKVTTLLLYSLYLLTSSCAHYSNSEQITREISSASENCNQFYSQILRQDNSVLISEEKFERLYDKLHKTLRGNPSTVFRSEWKAKENSKRAALFLEELINNFSPTLRNELNVNVSKGESYIQEVVSQIAKAEQGALSLRDGALPRGVTDRTFTYYTKSLRDLLGGKHQVRLRRYLRTVDFSQLKVSSIVRGYFEDKPIQIERLSENVFYITYATRINKANNELEGIISQRNFSYEEIKRNFGAQFTFYAFPHAQSYKLEIKTTPHDVVKNNNFIKLEGKNYVQKLSVYVNDTVRELLFSSEKDSNWLTQIEKEILKDPRNSLKRTQAILEVLSTGVSRDINFTKSLGATEYKRYAFEIALPDLIDGIPVKVQTTFDTDIGLRKIYNENDQSLSPVDSVKLNSLIKSKKGNDDFHIELKIPKVLIDRAHEGKASEQLMKLLEIFNEYNVINRGKFYYLLEQK